VEEASEGTLRFEETLSTKTAARIDVAGEQLDFRAGPENGLDIAWSDASRAERPVWASSGDTFSFLCAKDMEILSDGSLVLITDLGLTVRDADSFRLQVVDERFRNGSLVRLEGPARVAIEMNGRFVALWQDGQLTLLTGPDALAQTSVVENGGWQWRLTRRPGMETELRIVRPDEANRTRSWRQTTAGNWKFRDDLVTWLRRGVSDGPITLETEDGFWRLQARPFQRVDKSETPLSHDPESEITTPALRIACSEGKVSFHAFDGKSVFDGGRFFFDRGASFASFNEGLYVFVPGRCVVKRDPRSPATIMACFAPPSDMPSDCVPNLIGGAALRLMTRERHRQWTFQTSAAADASWQSEKLETPQVAGQVGNIVWRPISDTDMSLAPCVEADETGVQPLPIPDWWHEDRFAWDVTHAVGLLDDNRTGVLVTQAGLARVDLAQAGQYPMTLTVLRGQTRCDVARANGKRTGVVVGGDAEFPQYHVSCMEGPWRLERIDASPSLRSVAHLTVAFQDDGMLGKRRLELTQSWIPRDLLSENAPLLRSRIPDISDDRLLADGRFVFDAADAGCALESFPGKEKLWLLATHSQNPENGGSSFLCLNAIEENRLVLRDIKPCSRRIDLIREAEAGSFFTAQKAKIGETVSWRFHRSSWKDGPLAWEEIDAQTTGNAFRVGDTVVLRAPSLAWSSEPRYAWSDLASAPFTASPADYAALIDMGDRRALAFDVLTSAAMLPDSECVAVGSLGGILLLPWREDGKQALREARLVIGDEKNRIRGVERVRVFNDVDGRPAIWARTSAMEATSFRCEVGHAVIDLYIDKQPWSFQAPAPDGGILRVEADGLLRGKGDSMYAVSNDAWRLGRKPLRDVADILGDAAFSCTWVCTRSEGLFKTVSDRKRPRRVSSP